VYFCTLEALQNVAKYAGVDSVRIDLAQRDGHLDFEMADDGAGFDPAQAQGSGLQGMRDRLEALGGSVAIESRVGAGTLVRGTVPVAAAGDASPPDTASERQAGVAASHAASSRSGPKTDLGM
jgi:glucose-6-phosphate-specific signal transduction histidine kinase